MNKVELLGRLTKKVEIKKGKNTKYGYFTLAIKRPYAKENEQDTDFLDCVMFGKPLDALEKYTDKGTQIIVCGSIQNNIYDDKDGNRKSKIIIVVNDFYFTGAIKKKEEEINSDELPFG